MHFGPCYLGSKSLQQACNKLELNKMVGEASVKLRFIQELENGQSLLLFLLILLKNNNQLKSNVPKNTLKVFWVTTLVTKKKLSKKLLKGANLVLQKGTKESKISLGSWLSIWADNEICTFLAKFKSLKNRKRNYLMSKL